MEDWELRAYAYEATNLMFRLNDYPDLEPGERVHLESCIDRIVALTINQSTRFHEFVEEARLRFIRRWNMYHPGFENTARQWIH